MLFLILIAVKRAYKFWNIEDAQGNLVSFGTPVVILFFNRYISNGAIITNDLHHPYEDIIGFSQIFELGQTPFSEYIPVSGMYSIIQGALFKLLGNGIMTYYDDAKEVFYILVILLIIALMWNRFDKRYILVFSVFFSILEYNRVVFILPFILLLTDRRLINKKFEWLLCYFLTSLFQGLYYPVYGAAVCIGFMPLAIKVLFSYLHIDIKNEYKSIKFWGATILSFIILVLCCPLLLGTLKHTLAMGGQTILADGLPRFGQGASKFFIPYLDKFSFVKIAVYYVSSFVPLALIIWIAFALFLLLYSKNKNEIKNIIYIIRGKQVMLDRDLAKLYCCKNGTKTINQAVKRNIERFPERFMFQLNENEYKNLRSQIGTTKFNI